MRVVRIVSELDFGGVEKVLVNSLPALQMQKGLKIKIIVLGQGGRVADELVAKGIQLQILGVNPKIPNLKLVKKVRRILSEFRPDVVHSQGGEANFHGILAAKLAKVPLIIGEEIGIPNHHSFWKYIFKWIYRKADRIIAISQAVKEAIVELGEVEANKVTVVYNPVTSFQFSVFSFQLSTRKGDSEFKFISTCRLVPIKNLDRLLIAFESLLKANPSRMILLEIVGDGSDRENLKHRIQKLELNNHVNLVGFQQDIMPFLEEADAFILPSLREGSSVSLAEAMTAGLPSIVTKIGGASEILGESRSGYLIDPLEVKSIQASMQQMIDLSKEDLRNMGVRAKRASERFSIENYMKTILDIYSFSDFRFHSSDT